VAEKNREVAETTAGDECADKTRKTRRCSIFKTRQPLYISCFPCFHVFWYPLWCYWSLSVLLLSLLWPPLHYTVSLLHNAAPITTDTAFM